MDTPKAMRSLGKLRGLQQLATPTGRFALCAMDHRESLRGMLDPADPDRVSAAEVVRFKMDLCRALAPASTGVLLDPLHGAPSAIARGVLPGSVGLLVSMEASGYQGGTHHRATRLLDGWDADKARRMGATGAKLLLYYRPEAAELSARQREVAGELALGCLEQDLALLVEAVAYPLEEEAANPALFAGRRPGIVVQTARELSELPVDILKLEFPLDPDQPWDGSAALDACRAVTKAAGLPWVLLSRGVPYELFRRQVEVACRGGASGFLGGRAIWQEAASMPAGAERGAFLEGTAVGRMRELAAVVEAEAAPWWEKLGPEDADPPADWYARY